MLRNKKLKMVIICIALFAAMLIALLAINTINFKAKAESLSKANICDKFSEDNCLIVLNAETSKYRGIDLNISNQLYELGATEIIDLSELPETITYADGSLNSTAAPALAEYYSKTPFKQILQVKVSLKEKQSILDFILSVRDIKGIYSAEPNYSAEFDSTQPSDSRFSEQWGLGDGYGIRAEKAWKITKGSQDVRVGVIDSGIFNHEDLVGNLVGGKDFYNNNDITTDDIGGHGTHVAGIIGAESNAKGIIGVCPNVTLVPLQAAENTSGSGTYPPDCSTRISAINYATRLWGTDQQISVLNQSIGGFGQTTTLLAAINNYPGLFVWSAGNQNKNLDNYENIEQFNLPNLISVGAITKNGLCWSKNIAEGSNSGKNSVDLFAPGVGILSTVPHNVDSSGYKLYDGTSMAAPHVTGVAALLLSIDKNLTGAQLKDIICKSVEQNNYLANHCITGGRLNASKALKYFTNAFSNVYFDKQGGNGGTETIIPYFEEQMPQAIAPTCVGKNFKGYFSQPNGQGTQYYDENMVSMKDWDRSESSVTLYAHWEIKTCKIYIRGADINQTISLKYGEKIPESYAPVKSDHKFIGLFSDINGKGTKYARAELKREYGRYAMKMIGEIPWNNNGDGTLYAHFERMQMDFQITQKDDAYPSNVLGTYSQKLISGQNNVLTAPEYSGYEFVNWLYNDIAYEESTLTKEVRLHISETTGEVAIYHDTWGGDGNIEIIYSKKSCVAEGTLITLADGSQVPVESLTGDEMLLVWNLKTGSFDIAPILLIDKDPAREYKIINLSFSDGTSVKVISEHGFWDFDLNRYVYLDENAAEYLGHWFNKQYTEADGGFAYKKVQLTDVNITVEYTTAWSPETYGHLCYYVNGMLSMPGGSTGLFNIFEVDAETMRYDEEAFARDIEQYGLFTYEEFNELLPVPEFVFEAYNGQYLKVAIGKGLITMEGLQQLAKRYLGFFE